MKNAEHVNQLMTAMENFKAAYDVLLHEVDKYEQLNKASVNDLPGFTEKYPFDKSFDELAIPEWVDHVADRVRQQNFTVLNYNYLNTGGNCMVGIFDVYLPEENRVVYMLTNEEGCNMATVDYISNELIVNDYDELIIDYVDWGRVTGYEKHFELYRYCLNEYTKSDCKYFGYTRELPYHLLSDELQSKVPAGYCDWCKDNNGDVIATDGEQIIVNPDYDPTDYETQLLKSLREFQQWHASTAADEKYYEEDYKLTFAGKSIEMPFVADVWDAVDSMLESVIRSY